MPLVEAKQQVNINLPRTYVQEIEALARAEQRSRASFLQLLIIECLEHRKRNAKPSSDADLASTN